MIGNIRTLLLSLRLKITENQILMGKGAMNDSWWLDPHLRVSAETHFNTPSFLRQEFELEGDWAMTSVTQLMDG